MGHVHDTNLYNYIELCHSRKKEMKIVTVALRSLKGNFSHRFQHTYLLRSLSTRTISENGTVNQHGNGSEPLEEFEQRIFNPGRKSKIDNVLDKLNQHGRARDRSSSMGGRSSEILDDLEQSFDTLSDGMDGKLNEAANYFEFDPEQIDQEDYAFRYDVVPHITTSTYSPKELDLTKPAARKPPPRNDFTVTTKEVLSRADFRNVRFLANFITEAGILIKRSQTGISAKAQRRVAREIKTARAFGLMPFTTMGTKSFIYGRTMENLDEDFGYREPRNMPAKPDLQHEHND